MNIDDYIYKNEQHLQSIDLCKNQTYLIVKSMNNEASLTNLIYLS